MALTEINKLMPRLRTNKPTTTRELIDYATSGTTFTAGDVVGSIYMLRQALLHFATEAKPMRLEALGIFTPTVKLDGTISIKFRPDKSLIQDLNGHKAQIKQYITNKKNLGKTIDEIKVENQ